MSIVSGVHHVWRHRGKTEAESKDAKQYLHHVRILGEDLDLTVTACFLSVPLVSLLWSVICFTVALGSYCIQHAGSGGMRLLATIMSIAGICACATLVFFWQIWNSPRHREIEEEYNLDTALNVDPPTWRQKVQTRWKDVGFWSLIRKFKGRVGSSGSNGTQSA